MNTTMDKINYVNIGLILISFGIAIYLPFELFLFSYAVLGPLHYLTEIAWLHKQDYFLSKKQGFPILVAIGVITGIGFLGNFSWGQVTLPIAFFTALGLFLFNDWRKRIVIIATGIGLSVFLDSFAYPSDMYWFYVLLFVVFLPTIIHVFVFTGLFMVYGNLKSKSVTGHITFAIFISCAVLIFFVDPGIQYDLSQKLRQTYDIFTIVNHSLIQLLGMDGYEIGQRITKEAVFESPAGITSTRFIAFVYTYHYLNWFSKTSVIKWHKIAVPKLVAIVVLWIISVGLYYGSYEQGFKVLFILSMMHVYLEFPLNFKTIGSIAKSLVSRGKS